jgi:hypothetical protein
MLALGLTIVTRRHVMLIACLLSIGRTDIRGQAQRVSSPQVDVTTSVEGRFVGAGSRLTLVTEVVPKDGLHVYAPGARGYQVIALHLAPAPFVRVRPTRYPTSETYYFAPLKERVATYQAPFVLRTPISLDQSREARQRLARTTTLTLRGSLDFQACNDRLCFTPVSLPVTFSVALDTAPSTPRSTAPAAR